MRKLTTFDVTPALSEEERRACFALRHRVYIEEYRWFDDDGTGVEYDEYDSHALLFLARLDGIPAGTARLIFASSGALPSEHHLSADICASLRECEIAAEISRITVCREFRQKGLACALKDRLIEEARRRGITALLIDTFIEGPMTWKRIWEASGFKPAGDAYPFTGPSGTFLSMVMKLPLEVGADMTESGETAPVNY
ncbi:MAG: GNAT family N-acetyltransferase [Candidatus Xenobiia bacterium LiM19]